MRSLFNKIILFFVWSLSSFIFLTSAHAAWQSVNNGFTIPGQINVIATHSSNFSKLYAGSFFGGLYKTDNHADKWQQVAAPIFAGTNIQNIVFHPGNTNTIYVATQQKGVYKTEDDGRTWRAINSGLNSLWITSLVINQQKPDELYLTAGHDVYKTTDGGLHWRIIEDGIKKDKKYPTQMEYVVIHPTKPNILFLETSHLFSYALYGSTDSGKSWQLLKDDDYYTKDMTFASDNAKLMYAIRRGNFCFSTDNGDSWQTLYYVTNSDHYANAFVINPNNSQQIFLQVIGEGIYKSADAGKNWQLMSDVGSKDGLTLFTNPSEELYLTTENSGLLFSTNGADWIKKNNGFLNPTILSVAADPNDAKLFYAGTAFNGLWIMRDGKTWQPVIDKNFANDNIDQIFIDPKNSANVLMIARKDLSSAGETKIIYFKNYIYVSHDYGKTWQLTKTDPAIYFSPLSLAFNPVNPREVFAGNKGRDDVKNIWISEDGGDSFMQYSQAGDYASNFFGDAFSLVVNPKNPKQLFVGTKSAYGHLVFQSDNAGKTWESIGVFCDNCGLGHGDEKQVLDLTIDSTQPNVMYAVTAKVVFTPETVQLYKTTDGGVHWIVMNKGLKNIPSIHSIIVDPKDSQTIYMTTGFEAGNFSIGHGIYVSHDGGESWSMFKNGLNNPLTTALLFDRNNLYAGTIGSGLWRMNLN